MSQGVSPPKDTRGHGEADWALSLRSQCPDGGAGAMGVSVWGHLVFGLLYFYIRQLSSVGVPDADARGVGRV